MNEKRNSRATAIRFHTAPYVRLARRLISGRGSPKSVASEIEVVCPSETQSIAPPIYIAEHLDRITSGTEHNSAEAEIQSMLNCVAKHAATKAFHIKNAVIQNGSVYAKNMRWFLFPSLESGEIQELRQLGDAALVSSAVGCRYFGHWLRDDCNQYFLAASSWPTIAMGREMTAHQTEYAALFGQDWTMTNSAMVDHLVIYQDHGENTSKRARAKQLRQRIAPPDVAKNRNARVFLKRGGTGAARPIHDEDALLESLVAQGFEVVDVTSDLATIIRKLSSAKLVVSMEGSHIAHCAYCLSEGCALLVLQPHDRFTSVHRGWSSSRGIRFGFAVGTRNSRGYEFAVTDILKLSDALLDSTNR